MARQKTVYGTNEIAHLWAHQTQQTARNPQGNFHFNGGIIKSYAATIARTGLHKGKRYYLVSSSTWSVTTSRHQSDVRRAVRGNGIVFNLLDINERIDDRDNIKSIWVSLGNRAKRHFQEYKAATNKTQRCIKYSAYLAIRQTAIEFAEFFGLAHKAVCKLPIEHDVMLRLIAERETHKAEQSAKTSARFQRERDYCWGKMSAEDRAAFETEKAERETKRVAKLQSAIENWRLNGVLFAEIRTIPTMMRIVRRNDHTINHDEPLEVMTSQGARFPLEHALRAMPLVARILERGEQWQRNGHSIHLGHYQIDRIDASGTLFAGCHVVRKDELLRLIEELKAIQVPEFSGKETDSV